MRVLRYGGHLCCWCGGTTCTSLDDGGTDGRHEENEDTGTGADLISFIRMYMKTEKSWMDSYDIHGPQRMKPTDLQLGLTNSLVFLTLVNTACYSQP